MATIDIASANAALALLFANGRGEAGLEVGADPGLAVSEYIRIPARMLKRVAFRAATAASRPTGKPVDFDPNTGIDGIQGEDGWTVVAAPAVVGSATSVFAQLPRIQVQDGKFEYQGEVFEGVYTDAPSIDDIRAFVQVNEGHIRAQDFSPEQQRWIHSARFWAVVAGFVATSKSSEWMVVPNPATVSTANDDVVMFIYNDWGNAWTAAAARTTSWRKTNHATGGQIAAGYPLRVLQKGGFWPTTQDPATRNAQSRTATDMFYVGNHATSVHAVLALMIPDDPHHWADIGASFGFIASWDRLESTRLRMAPRTQVAGAALPVDAMVVLQMAVKEGIAPLIGAIDQLPALVAMHSRVVAEGMAIAVYAKWFFDGHRDAPVLDPFSQKDAASMELIAELAVIAREYYPQSTIAASAALRNAAAQMADEQARNVWATLGSEKRRMRADKVLAVVRRMKGASASAAVDQMLSDDDTEVHTGVGAYNARNAAIARAIGLSRSFEINADAFIASRDAA